jgi:hypothetical protein
MYYKAFFVTGVANKTIMDSGLVSSIEEPKTIKAILIDVSLYCGNILEGWIETERILEIDDRVLNSSYLTGADQCAVSTSKIVRIPIDEDVKPGMIFKIGINCGAAESNIAGAYEYIRTP